MSGFDGYDQWKTASPYDDYDDEHCVYCGAELPDDVTGLSQKNEDAVMDGFCNADHMTLYDTRGAHPDWGRVLTDEINPGGSNEE